MDASNWDIGLVGSHEHGFGATAPGVAGDAFITALWTSPEMGVDDLAGHSTSLSGSVNTPFRGLGPIGSKSFPTLVDWGGDRQFNPGDVYFQGSVTEVGVSIGSPGVDAGLTHQISHTAKLRLLEI